MTDLVERLREYDQNPRLWTARLKCAGKAADEIERLEELVAYGVDMRIVLAEEKDAEIKRLRAANDRLGSWMAAALDDPRVCEEMKADIRAWFAVGVSKSILARGRTMRDYRAELNGGRCKENHGCNVATVCLCALAEDMVDEIEELRAARHL